MTASDHIMTASDAAFMLYSYICYMLYMLCLVGYCSCVLLLCYAGRAAGQCESDKDCANRNICDLSTTTSLCTCNDTTGADTCKQMGACIPFCKSAQAMQKLEAANSQVVVCDPFLPNTCSGGLVCEASSAGVQLMCKEGVGIVPVEVGGVCVPADRKVLTGRFSADGKQVLITLNAAARTASFSCSSLFSSSALGTRAWCSAADRMLSVQLDGSATLLPGQQLALRSPQSVLVDKLQSDVVFQGSVTVEACTDCSKPTAIVTGPQVCRLLIQTECCCM